MRGGFLFIIKQYQVYLEECGAESTQAFNLSKLLQKELTGRELLSNSDTYSQITLEFELLVFTCTFLFNPNLLSSR